MRIGERFLGLGVAGSMNTLTQDARHILKKLLCSHISPAEVSKPTVSEGKVVSSAKESLTAEIALEPVRPKAESLDETDLDRGGALHSTLQKRLQAEAQKLSFQAVIEGRLKEG